MSPVSVLNVFGEGAEHCPRGRAALPNVLLQFSIVDPGR